MTKTVQRTLGRGGPVDAAERLLLEVGHAGITTRRLAEAAGVNHGLVHYYFGSTRTCSSGRSSASPSG